MFTSIIPQGPIYTELRDYVLQTYVDGAKATFNNSPTLSEWFRNGTYSVVSSTSTEYILHVSSVDFASALLTDVEHLFNHCFEQFQEMMCFHLDTRIRSDSWDVVTEYYFAFFSAQITLRLLGRPVVYLKSEKTNELKQMGGFTVGPGGGSFRIEKISNLSSTHSEYRLKKLNPKIHDATWKDVLQLFSDLIRNPILSSNIREVQFFSALTTTSLFSSYGVGYAWPSEVRTAANYRAGYAYRLVLKEDITKAKKMMETWKRVEQWDGSKGVQALLTSSISSCISGIGSLYSSHAQLLHDISLCIFMLNRELYSELLTRRGIDKRWENSRKKYCAGMAFPEGDYNLLRCVFDS